MNSNYDAAITNAAALKAKSHISSRASMARIACVLIATATAIPCSWAQSVESEGSASGPLAEVVVSGEQPGPGLWKVSKGDHVLWILGTLSPSPRKMTWRSRQVESVIARSQEVIARESIETNIGFFRGMMLLPSALRARKNANGAVLRDVLPPDLYARWSVLKSAYIGNDRGIEEWRPMFAALQLYSKALEKSGLSRDSGVWPTVRKIAKKQGVRITNPVLKADIDNPRQAIRDFTQTPRDVDIACFTATVERLETDLEPMKQRANAWAVGDVDALQRLPFPNQEAICREAFTSVPQLKEEYYDIKARSLSQWQTAAEAALSANESTLALLPISELLDPKGRLSKFQAKGYTVESP